MRGDVWLRPRRLPVVGAPPKCEHCRGEGLLELAPALDGRWACTACRYTERRRLAAMLAAKAREKAAK